MATGLEKVNFNSNPKEGDWQRMFKLPQIVLISRASKVMHKALQARLQQYVNHKFPDIQAGYRKGRRARDQIVSIHWIIRNIRKFLKKTSTSALLTPPKPLTMWITTNCGKFFKRW